MLDDLVTEDSELFEVQYACCLSYVPSRWSKVGNMLGS